MDIVVILYLCMIFFFIKLNLVLLKIISMVDVKIDVKNRVICILGFFFIINCNKKDIIKNRIIFRYSYKDGCFILF